MKFLEYVFKYKWFIVFLVCFCVGGVSYFYSILTSVKSLPIYSPSMVNSELVDTLVQDVRKYHRITDFELINQNNQKVTHKDYEGKVYIVDFFFTTCQTICPRMTQNLKYIQDRLPVDSDILLLSHTVIPEYDTPKRLKEYAISHGVDEKRWNLVTASKKVLYDLARKSYLVSKTQGNAGPYDMIHTENIVLVDQKRRIRGFYDGTKNQDINQLLKDAIWLSSQ